MVKKIHHLLVVKFLMVLSGSWRVKLESLTDRQRSLYFLYSVAMHIYLFCFVASLYIGAVPLFKSDLDKTIQAVSVIILCTLILVKAYICQRKQITKIVSQIEIAEKEIDRWDRTTLQIYKKFAVYTKYISIGMFAASSMCGVTLIVTKFIVYIQQKHAASMGLLNYTKIEKPLPYIIWRPVDETKHYITAFFIDVLSASVGCTFNSVTQIIFISLMSYISGQLSILQMKFRNYGADCTKLDTYEEKFARLKELILDHKKIISFVEELDDNMKYLMLLEFTINSFEITGIFYEFLTFKKDAVVIFRIMFMGCMILQIFVLAWHANEISLQSIEISRAVYECEWYDLPQTLKDYLLVIIMRSQKPLSISVGPFFTLTNSTAVTSIKGAYSYLALLTNRRNRKQ